MLNKIVVYTAINPLYRTKIENARLKAYDVLSYQERTYETNRRAKEEFKQIFKLE